MRKIVQMRFGSYLYGTMTPESDLDLKGVFVPSAKDILLQRAAKTIRKGRQKQALEKNKANDVDEELFSLQKYLDLLIDGKPVALDMLFAPDWAMTAPVSGIWLDIRRNRNKILTKKSSSFIEYCRRLANKYGIKESRVAAARAALVLLTDLVNNYPATMKLSEFSLAIKNLVAKTEHMEFVSLPTKPYETMVHWVVCDRRLPFATTIKYALGVVQRMVNTYDTHTLLAEKKKGVNWKALSHAVRIGHEGLELLENGFITFPLPNAEHIVDIKLGRLTYREVSSEIEELLVKIEKASDKSVLRSEPDTGWMDWFIAYTYRNTITEKYG